ncbi:hypothetical protein C8R45DRAFT_1082955 [Mycena sanguinolenta]|nr:hypothetical protein C8R45DRAFT_1082955 [Mycena sanguinolenta]
MKTESTTNNAALEGMSAAAQIFVEAVEDFQKTATTQCAQLGVKVEKLEGIIEKQRDEIKAAHSRLDTLADKCRGLTDEIVREKETPQKSLAKAESFGPKAGRDIDVERAELEAQKIALKKAQTKLKLERASFAREKNKFVTEGANRPLADMEIWPRARRSEDDLMGPATKRRKIDQKFHAPKPLGSMVLKRSKPAAICDLTLP